LQTECQMILDEMRPLVEGKLFGNGNLFCGIEQPNYSSSDDIAVA